MARKTKLMKMQEKAFELIDTDYKNRNEMFQWMSDAYANNWSFPKGRIPEWMHVTSSSDPHDAVRSGAQILSTTAPKIHYHPLSDDILDKEKATKIERALEWQFNQAARRTPRKNLVRDITRDALLYGMVAGQVVYLPYQQKIMKGMGKNTRWAKQARRHGKYAIVLRDPRTIYPVWSDFMLEGVLHATHWSIPKFKAFWGDGAFAKIMKKWKHEDEPKWIYVYDNMDLDERFIWGKPLADAKDVSHEDAGAATVLMDEKHGLDFLPWFIAQDGDGGELNPLLYPLYKSGHWTTQNVIMTLLVSDVISIAYGAKSKSTTPAGEGVEVDHTTPDAQVKLMSGQDYDVLPPRRLDPGQTEMLDRITASIGKQTVASILMNPEMKADVPFSAMNLIFQLGAQTLSPYKKLGEDAIAEIYIQMLYWLDKTGDSIMAFGQEEDGMLGEQLAVAANDFDVDNLYIDVRLEAKIPQEEVARANAASIKKQSFNIPDSTLLEDMGHTNPDVLLKEWKDQQRELNDFQIELQMKQNQAAIKMQEDQAMAQAAIQTRIQGMMQMGQQVQQQQQQGQQGQQGVQAAEQGFNPALGGQPPAQAAPELGREQLTGRTRAGQGIV